MSDAGHLLPLDNVVRQITAPVVTANSGLEVGRQPDQNASSLCSECKAIFDHWYDRDAWATTRPGQSHHHVVGLQESSQNGCSVCNLFLNGLSESAVNTLTQSWPYVKSSVSVTLDPIYGNDRNYAIKLAFHFDGSESEEPLETILDAFPSVNNTTAVGTIQEVADADENWALIQKWLKVCKNTHTRCIQNTPLDGQLPTRLLEVGENDKDLKVRNTNCLPLQTQYLTLSHCWGGKVFTTLTNSNFQQFQSHIPAENLSKTFREAISTTRRLGFKYIWIDSLCIIQGDETDWRREASKMGSVYANSSLNIAASAAPNGDFGCFTSRVPGQSYCCKVMVVERDADGSLHPMGNSWDITVPDLRYHLNTNVLSSRAWVFQEVFLAPRTLYFAPQQLVWECISAKACEVFPDSFDDGAPTMPNFRFGTWNSPTTSVAHKWISTVIQYSDKHVTFHRDKLIALSGIAHLFAAKFGTTYLAGMWKEELLIQLTWFAREPSSHEAGGFIPSWSWAAVDTALINTFYYTMSHYSPLVSVLEATSDVVDDIFGDVTGGTLQIKCPLPLLISVVKAYTVLFGVQMYDLADITYLYLYSDRIPYFVGQELYFLPLFKGVNFEGAQMLSGLVIEPVHTGSYRRTGYFRSRANEVERFLEAQKRATYEDKFFIGEALRPDDKDENMCIINLI